MSRGTFLMIFGVTMVAVSAFGGMDDKFIKKFAMMKIYESCYGQEVVKQIRKEMKAACAKCAALETPLAPPQQPTRPPPPSTTSQSPQVDDKLENTIYANEQSFNPDKLHEALLAFRPHSPSFRPYGPPQSVPGYFPGYPGPAYPGPMYLAGLQQPFAPSPYGMPLISPYFGSQRTSRDMDIRGQLEMLTSRMSGKVGNVTCVMQELGYLDDKLEPNFAKISERISNLPVQEELKRDMQEGLSFCQQFSQCVPEVKVHKSLFSSDLVRPMFFFKCYKHKKLEACIMKDVREKFSGVTDADLEGDLDLRRAGRAKKLPGDDKTKEDDDLDEMATSIYEFLYASDSNTDIDSLL